MSKKFKIPSYRVKLVRDRSTLTCRDSVHADAILRRLVSDNSRETMHVLYQDALCNIIGTEMVAMGGGPCLAVTAKEIIRGAIIAGAAAIVLGHNHPSGSPRASDDDVKVTKAVMLACKAVGISLSDHIITTENNGYSSMYADGTFADLERN